MKFLHTADLHIGKMLNNFSLMEDQRDILEKLKKAAIDNEVDAVIIAGDLYDRSVPPAEAVTLVDMFVTGLVEAGIKIFCVSGNHDSPERLSFANNILNKRGFYIESQTSSIMKKIELEDEHGRINIYTLPYFRVPVLREYCRNNYDVDPADTKEALSLIISNTPIDKSQRNILITHYFVTFDNQYEDFDGEIKLLPEQSLGGIDNVDVSIFKDFDYVALGHIHGYMRVGKGKCYYSSSPLKYSIKEKSQKKGYIIVELSDKQSEVETTFKALQPLHDLREIKGKLEDLISPEIVSLGNEEDYISVILTDEGNVYDPIGKMRVYYPNIVHISYLKDEQVYGQNNELDEKLDEKSPVEVFKSFIEYVVGEPAKEEHVKLVENIIERFT